MFYKIGYKADPVLGNLLYLILLIKFMPPLFINWFVFLTVKSLFNWPVFPLQPSLKLYVPYLLKPFYKLLYILGCVHYTY